MVQWKIANYLRGNDPIGDEPPIFDGTIWIWEVEVYQPLVESSMHCKESNDGEERYWSASSYCNSFIDGTSNIAEDLHGKRCDQNPGWLGCIGD